MVVDTQQFITSPTAFETMGVANTRKNSLPAKLEYKTESNLHSVFSIKGTSYSVASLLRNKKLAKEYVGGYSIPSPI